MTKEFEDKGNNYSIRENVNIGEVRVADEVVAIIAGLAVTVDLALIIRFGYEIPKVSKKVQEKVKSAIETMTGLDVVAVNIKIAGVNIEAE